jgi:lipopolysaccharide transport system permease protein
MFSPISLVVIKFSPTIRNALFFGVHDFRQRYRGARFGIWWGPITTAIFIGFLSIIWSTLFKVELSSYLIFFSIGHLVWAYISACLGEASSGLQQFEAIVKNVKLGLTFHVLRIAARNALAFAINSIVLLAVLVAFPSGWNLHSLWLLGFGLVILAVLSYSLTALTLVLCTAYRDATPLVNSGLTMLMFATPIMWAPALMLESPYRWVVELNPLFHVIEAIRTPITGAAMSWEQWAYALGFAALMAAVAWFVMRACRDKVAYWL